MALTCSVNCTMHGITATHAVVTKVTAHKSGTSEGKVSLFKDNTATSPFMHLTFTFATDMDSGTDGKGVNLFEAAEQALLTTDGASMQNSNFNNAFVGATQV